MTKGKKERGRTSSWHGASYEAEVIENREKRVDESGRMRDEQRTRFSASTV